MNEDTSLVRIRAVGRVVLWVVVLVIVASAIYTASVALTNWRFIGV